MIKFLAGRKSYLLAFAGAVVILLAQLDYITADVANNILIWIFPAGLATLKAGQTRIENKL